MHFFMKFHQLEFYEISWNEVMKRHELRFRQGRTIVGNNFFTRFNYSFTCIRHQTDSPFFCLPLPEGLAVFSADLVIDQGSRRLYQMSFHQFRCSHKGNYFTLYTLSHITHPVFMFPRGPCAINSLVVELACVTLTVCALNAISIRDGSTTFKM
jgi:hypothetical protein